VVDDPRLGLEVKAESVLEPKEGEMEMVGVGVRVQPRSAATDGKETDPAIITSTTKNIESRFAIPWSQLSALRLRNHGGIVWILILGTPLEPMLSY
jgi:hypothetical protein